MFLEIKIIVVSLLFAFILLSTGILFFVMPKKSKAPGILLIKALFYVNGIYDLGYALELLHSSVDGKLFSNHFQYLGLVFIAMFWFMLAYRYAHKSFRWTVAKALPFTVIPLMTLFFNLTFPFNGFFYSAYKIVEWEGMSLLILNKGFWYYINAAYQSGLVLIAGIFYYRTMTKSMGVEKKQARMLMILSFICFLMTFSTFLTNSTSPIDYGPIVITVFSFLFLVTLFEYELFELLPSAYNNIFEAADYPIMILSDTFCVAKANRIAQTFFGDLLKDRYYMPIGKVFEPYTGFQDILTQSGKYSFKINYQGEGYYFIANLSRLDIKRRGRKSDLGYLLFFSNETTHIKRIRNLEVESSVDPLTGTYNRRYFFKVAEYMAEKAAGNEKALSFIMLDIDNFKKINDTYGHQAGDHVLAATAAVIKQQLREADIFTRFGGEEFIVILPSTKPESALAIANRICSAVRETALTYQDKNFHLTISGGVTGSETVNQSINEYITLADKALYKAKDSGKDKVYLMLASEKKQDEE